MSAKYFEYYTPLYLGGPFFRGHAVEGWCITYAYRNCRPWDTAWSRKVWRRRRTKLLGLYLRTYKMTLTWLSTC